jgi:hypothetical protein
MQLDDDPHPLAVRLVVQRGDPGDLLLFVRVGDRLEDAVNGDFSSTISALPRSATEPRPVL